MFRSAPVLEPPPDEVISTVDKEPVPLSVLSLDLSEPPEGWAVFLAARDIEVTLDDIGRMSVARVDARRLLTEKREREAEQARRRKLAEARAVADDQLRRVQIWGGAPAVDGVSAAALMLQANRDAQPKRQSVLQHALANTGEPVFHPITQNEE
jgi:hypothetical protein